MTIKRGVTRLMYFAFKGMRKNSRQYLLGCMDIIQPARRALVTDTTSHNQQQQQQVETMESDPMSLPLYWSHPVAAMADVALLWQSNVVSLD
jgi:hypothetical protein